MKTWVVYSKTGKLDVEILGTTMAREIAIRHAKRYARRLAKTFGWSTKLDEIQTDDGNEIDYYFGDEGDRVTVTLSKHLPSGGFYRPKESVP